MSLASEVWMDEDDGSLIIMRPNQQRDEKRDYTCVARGMENGEVKEESKMIIKIRIKRKLQSISDFFCKYLETCTYVYLPHYFSYRCSKIYKHGKSGSETDPELW